MRGSPWKKLWYEIILIRFDPLYIQSYNFMTLKCYKNTINQNGNINTSCTIIVSYW